MQISEPQTLNPSAAHNPIDKEQPCIDRRLRTFANAGHYRCASRRGTDLDLLTNALDYLYNRNIFLHERRVLNEVLRSRPTVSSRVLTLIMLGLEINRDRI